MTFNHIPGGEEIEKGLADLAAARETVEALLVSIAAPRLERAGLEIPAARFPDPERRLYDLLTLEHGDDAHGHYNSLIRRVVSFARAVECAN